MCTRCGASLILHHDLIFLFFCKFLYPNFTSSAKDLNINICPFKNIQLKSFSAFVTILSLNLSVNYILTGWGTIWTIFGWMILFIICNFKQTLLGFTDHYCGTCLDTAKNPFNILTEHYFTFSNNSINDFEFNLLTSGP